MTQEKPPAISFHDLTLGYGRHPAVHHIIGEVDRGDLLALVGPNGAGKSTLLKAIAGLVALKQGEIILNGANITAADALGRSRQGIGFVPQERNVFGAMTVAENLEISAFRNAGEARRRSDELYARYPILAQKRRALARTLSGGQRQILAVAMGLMNLPTVLLLDEPTAGLSPRAADELFDAIVALNRSGLPILMVEQHAVEALAISARGYVLVSGRKAREGRGPELAESSDIRRLFLGG